MPVASFLARSFICFFGLAAVAWGGVLLPSFWLQAPLNRLVAKVQQGETFESQVLLSKAQQQDEASARLSICNATASHNAVVLRLAILDQAIAGSNEPLIDLASNSTYDAALQALSCVPADSFVWLALFWLDAGKHGFGSPSAAYLRLSYALGPNEGWIALWRNGLAMALFMKLPADLADDALSEFVKLVDTGLLYQQTAAIFANADRAVQDRIVEHLNGAKIISRRAFAKAVYDRGVDVNIPGVEMPGAHAW
jgi:hypothetical protein